MPSYGPNLVIGDIIEVVSVCKTTDQIGLNVFHYRVDGVGVADPLSKIVDCLEGVGVTYSANLLACISSSAEFRGYRVRRLNAPFSIFFDDTRGAGPGTVAGDMLPRQVAGLISKRVLVPGRRKGGRYYCPFPGEGDNAATAVPTAGYKTRLDALAVSIGSTLTTGLTFIASPVVQQITYVGGVMILGATRNYAQAVANDKWATQRRRGSYGRTNVSPL